MRIYIDVPELKKVDEVLYNEDDCIKIANNYFKAIKDRMREIITDKTKFEKDSDEILQFLGYAINNVKDEKSINDMFKI